MNVAPIVPLNYLDVTELSQYHLVLAPWVLKSQEYARWYRALSDKGHFVILDNGAHEVGIGNNSNQLLAAADLVCAKEIVLPDRLFWGEDTFNLSRAAGERLLTKKSDLKFMVVPQGRTFWEWFKWMKMLVQLPRVFTVGISKDYSVWSGGLEFLVQLVRAVASDLEIHLLGYPRNGVGVSRSSWKDIRGIDSAKPAVAAYYGLPWSQEARIGPRPSRFLEGVEIDRNLLVQNIRRFISTFNDVSIPCPD